MQTRHRQGWAWLSCIWHSCTQLQYFILFSFDNLVTLSGQLNYKIQPTKVRSRVRKTKWEKPHFKKTKIFKQKIKCALTTLNGNIFTVTTIVKTNVAVRTLENVQVWWWWAANIIQPDLTEAGAIPAQSKQQIMTEIPIFRQWGQKELHSHSKQLMVTTTILIKYH